MRPRCDRLSSGAGLPALLALGVLVAAGTACSSQRDALSRDIEQVRNEIKQLRADSLTMQDRVEALEQRPGTAAPGPGPAAGSVAADRPPLSVVRLMPQSDEPAVVEQPAAPEAADASSRTVLRGDKNGARIEESGSGGADGAKAGPAGGQGKR